MFRIPKSSYFVTSKSQLLLRWDSYAPDSSGPDNDLLILGYNLFPTSVTELQANYIIPGNGDIEDHQILLNFQLSF